MEKHEAGKKGGLATLARYGVRHYSIIGKQGGRPPLSIIAPAGAPGQNFNAKGAKQSAGNISKLLKSREPLLLDMRNQKMNEQKTNTKEYIPDTSLAEEWITEDIFIVGGMRYRIEPDGQIIRIGRNGNDNEGGENYA